MTDEPRRFSSGGIVQLGDPDFRVVLRRGRIWLSRWEDDLVAREGITTMLGGSEASDSSIADLTLVGRDCREVMVQFLSAGSSRSGEASSLIEWSTVLGYRRIWFADRLAELQCSPELLGSCQLDCGICGLDREIEEVDFLLGARQQGFFPMTCPVCGSGVAQCRTISI